MYLFVQDNHLFHKKIEKVISSFLEKALVHSTVMWLKQLFQKSLEEKNKVWEQLT